MLTTDRTTATEDVQGHLFWAWVVGKQLYNLITSESAESEKGVRPAASDLSRPGGRGPA